MELVIANHSYYPRIGDTEEQHKLRKAYHLFDRKKIDQERLQKVQKETISDIIREQESSQLDVVTDGLILWNDPVSHLLRKVEGVEIKGLLRFFDTNFYFRQPVIHGKLQRVSSLLKEEASFLKKVTKKKTKVVLTGPWTLALLSKCETPLYKNREEIADALALILEEEIKELSSLGVDYIQIDEPGYLFVEPDWDWASQTLKNLAKHKGKAQIGLMTYFGDAKPLYAKLQKLPVDFLGLDCTYSPKLVDHIKKEGSDKDLSLGLLDGRNTKLEDPKEVGKILKSLSSLKGKTVYLTTSCGLEYLPRNRALDKLKILKAIKDGFKKGV